MGVTGDPSGWSDALSGGQPELDRLLDGLAAIAQAHGLEITSCAEERDLTPYGISPASAWTTNCCAASSGWS